MTHIAIVYHSGFGHTAKIAEHIEKGAASLDGTKVTLLKADEMVDGHKLKEDAISTLANADAIIFGTPTYMGSASALFKSFMEASSGIWSQLGWKDKVAAGFTNSLSMSGDKLNTLFQLAIFAAQHGMIWVGQAEPNASNEEGPSGRPDAINRIGSTLGSMAQSDNAPAEETPPSGDLKTAELLGERVARITRQFKAGASA